MLILQIHEAIAKLAKVIKKPILLVEPVYHQKFLDDYSQFEYYECAKCLGKLGEDKKNWGIVVEGAIIICDSEEEMNTLYFDIIGDDGPRKGLGYTNSYNGPYRAYACTFNTKGQALNENT